jgi:hypothetical protein
MHQKRMHTSNIVILQAVQILKQQACVYQMMHQVIYQAVQILTQQRS